MRQVSDRFTVMLDANVLYPFLMRDVLLSLAAAGLYRVQWTEQITDEWLGHLQASKPQKAEKLRRTVEIMRGAFPEAIIDKYEALIPSLNLPDPDDRHVLAAAIKGGAHAIVTCNVKDFPAQELSKYNLEVLSPDRFLVNTFQLYPDDAVRALRKMRERYEKPSYTAEELLLALARSNLVQLAAELRTRVDGL
jgi:predicted nucleic acid-binding protein